MDNEPIMPPAAKYDTSAMPDGTWKRLIEKHGDKIPDLTEKDREIERRGEYVEKIERATPEAFPTLMAAVEKAAAKAGIPVPPVYVLGTGDESVGASCNVEKGVLFFGRKEASLRTEGELEATALHEIGHGFQGRAQTTANNLRKAAHTIGGFTIFGFKVFFLGCLTHFASRFTGAGGESARRTLEDVVFPLAAVLAASTALTTGVLNTMRVVRHWKEFDADRFASERTDNPYDAFRRPDISEDVIQNIPQPLSWVQRLAGGAGALVDALNVSNVVKYWDKIDDDTHPSDEKRNARIREIIARREQAGETFTSRIEAVDKNCASLQK